MDQWEALLLSHWERLDEGPYRLLRAAISALNDPSSHSNDPVGGAVLAALATNPALVAPARERCLAMLERMRDGDDPDLVNLIALALDGLWLQGVVGLNLHDAAARQRIAEKALGLLGMPGALGCPDAG